MSYFSYSMLQSIQTMLTALDDLGILFFQRKCLWGEIFPRGWCNKPIAENEKVGVLPVGDNSGSVYRCEADYKPKSWGIACWGTCNIVLHDKEDFLMLLLSRVIFGKDTSYGESTATLLACANVLKVNANPSLVAIDAESVFHVVTGVTTMKKGFHADIIRRIRLILRYLTRGGSTCSVEFVMRPNTVLADRLVSIHMARGTNVSYREYAHVSASGGKKNYSSAAGPARDQGQLGHMEGLVWIPYDPAPKSNETILPPYYAKPSLLLDSSDSRFFRGVDYNHWLIILDPSVGYKIDSREELLDIYVKLVTDFFKSNPKACSRIYSAFRERFFGFGCVMEQKEAELFECLPDVLVALPDFYTVPELRDYGGEKISDGKLVLRSPEHQATLDEAENFPVGISGDRLRKLTGADFVFF